MRKSWMNAKGYAKSIHSIFLFKFYPSQSHYKSDTVANDARLI